MQNTNPINIVHVFDKELPYGGLTVAFRKVTPFKSGRMVECAVATCSIEDSFNKRVGREIALRNFTNGETIKLPLDENDGDLNGSVKAAFSLLYGVDYPQ